MSIFDVTSNQCIAAGAYAYLNPACWTVLYQANQYPPPPQPQPNLTPTPEALAGPPTNAIQANTQIDQIIAQNKASENAQYQDFFSGVSDSVNAFGSGIPWYETLLIGAVAFVVIDSVAGRKK